MRFLRATFFFLAQTGLYVFLRVWGNVTANYLLIRGGASGDTAAKGESETLFRLKATKTASGVVGDVSNALLTSSRFIGVPSTTVRPGRAAREDGDRRRATTLWPLEIASSTMSLPVRPLPPKTSSCILKWILMMCVY